MYISGAYENICKFVRILDTNTDFEYNNSLRICVTSLIIPSLILGTQWWYHLTIRMIQILKIASNVKRTL